MAARLLSLEDFAMTARIVVPVTPDLIKEVFNKAPALRRAEADVLARDPRFAIGIYRAAVAMERWTPSASSANSNQLHGYERDLPHPSKSAKLQFRIRVKSGHKAFSNGSGCGSRGPGRFSMSRAYCPKRRMCARV